MKKFNSIILVTYDQHRRDYPYTSYSVASILATLKHYDISASHYSFDINKFAKTAEGNTPFEFIEETDSIINYLKKFDCIALGITRWSEPFAYMLIKRLEDYKGKIVVGGYEITSMDKRNDLSIYNIRIDHYIKGYAEKALVKLMKGEYEEDARWIDEELDIDYLFSPYDKGILNTTSRKIYWETKRGCEFGCGFCEWGNAMIGRLELKKEFIKRDIEIFSKSNIEEINILDATFNVGNEYICILDDLLKKTTAKITFQARFETLKPKFLHFCSMHKDRLHLEFGLQTIHKNEMMVIGRINNINKIQESLRQLNQLNIDYEVSIIYAIPGQTISSFIDTIEFLRREGCQNIKAYPLQVPRNSELERKKIEYKLTFNEDKFHVASVDSSSSFTKEERFEMDCIAFSLAHEERIDIIPMIELQKLEGSDYEFTDKIFKHNAASLDKVLSEAFLRYHTYANLVKKKEVATTVNIHHAFKGITDGFSVSPLGLKSFMDWGNTKQLTDVSYRIIIGKSGYIYVFRNFQKYQKHLVGSAG